MRPILVAVALMFASTAPAGAHPDHDMYEAENPRELAMASAVNIVARMIERGAIPASWSAIHPGGASLRQRNGVNEWVVTFQNPAVADSAQRTLYVMLTVSGVYIAANYSGN